MKITGYKQLTERTKRVIETNLVQADPKSYISDYVYIANNKEAVETAAAEILSFADSDNFSVSTAEWIDLEDGIRTEVTEYWIYTYNSETEKGECLYQVYIDVANDGYIDYVQWKYEVGEN